MNGMRLISPIYFISVQEMENPLILIHDKKISNMNSLLPVLEISIKVSLFIHVSVSGDVLCKIGDI